MTPSGLIDADDTLAQAGALGELSLGQPRTRAGYPEELSRRSLVHRSDDTGSSIERLRAAVAVAALVPAPSQAHHSYADAPPLDVLLYPGGQGIRPQLHDDAQLDWVRRRRDDVPLMTRVCTGSLVYAAAGLLSHRPATTHWRSLDQLAELDPTIDVRPDEGFVDDGDIVTSAGVSAGIDMALHLVDRLAGTERARQVRRGIQYDPAPPV